MRHAGWVAVVALFGCEAGKPPTVATTGSASSSNATGSAAGSAGSAAAAPKPCELEGPYRLRFVSNGTDGWWLRFTIANGALTLHDKVGMLGLPAGVNAAKLDPNGCTISIAATTKPAGKLAIRLALDPATNVVTGTLERTDKYAVDNHTGSTAITGVRDAPRKHAPACISEGIWLIQPEAKTKWKLTEGQPRVPLGCKDGGEYITRARVRVEQLGDTLFIDEDSESEGQVFGRAKLVRSGDCTMSMSLELQDFKFVDAGITFAGDKLSGTAASSRWQFFEDGEAGENLWACSAKNVGLVGKRIAD